MQAVEPDDAARDRTEIFILAGLFLLILGILLVYSQTLSFTWDEGFHLLAAQLILHGKRPYLDFFLAQTPLYAYWNAFWMRLFGDTWRTAHTFSTLMTGGAVWLTMQFIFSRFPRSPWRLPVTIIAALLVGLNSQVIEYGTLGQPYGVGLLAIVAAFRFTLAAVARPGWRESAGAGFFALTAAACSLLTAPVAPVCLLWILWKNRAGGRLSKVIAFLVAGVIPLLPLLWLFVHGPQQVIFGAVKFHLFYRQVEWDGAILHNFEVLIAWADSGHALILLLLAIVGLVYITSRSGWPREVCEELYFCAILASAQGAYLFIARPTFTRYFLFAVPFLSILAAIGFFAVSSLTISPTHRFWPSLILAVVILVGAGKEMYEDKDRYTWKDLSEIAQKTDQVTPKNGLLWADEFVYFMTRRPPPSGFEYDDTHKLTLSPRLSAEFHIIPQPEVNQWVKEGKFDTVSSCDDEDKLKDFGLPGPYKQLDTVQECYIYWAPRR